MVDEQDGGLPSADLRVHFRSPVDHLNPWYTLVAPGVVLAVVLGVALAVAPGAAPGPGPQDCLVNVYSHHPLGDPSVSSSQNVEDVSPQCDFDRLYP